MPARKLSQADLDDLHAADDELMQSRPRRIVRRDDDGNEIEMTTQAELAAWKGISESHFHALKRTGWKMKRGLPYADRAINGDVIDTDAVTFVVDLLQDRLEKKDQRIRELEAEVDGRDDRIRELETALRGVGG